jgi:hypothetical protein
MRLNIKEVTITIDDNYNIEEIKNGDRNSNHILN